MLNSLITTVEHLGYLLFTKLFAVRGFLFVVTFVLIVVVFCVVVVVAVVVVLVVVVVVAVAVPIKPGVVRKSAFGFPEVS